MTARRCIAWFGALLAVGFIGTGVSIGSHPARAAMFGMTLAEDDVPGDKSLIEQSGEAATPSDDQAQTGSHAPKYPIKFKTVDYQESGDTGKLTLAGTAPPESPVYIYFDEEPLVKVLADKDGNWSAEKEVKLDDAAAHAARRAIRRDHAHGERPGDGDARARSGGCRHAGA